jgi:hypothetical protein
MEQSISSAGETDASVLHQALVDKLKSEGTIEAIIDQRSVRLVFTWP